VVLTTTKRRFQRPTAAAAAAAAAEDEVLLLRSLRSVLPLLASEDFCCYYCYYCLTFLRQSKSQPKNESHQHAHAHNNNNLSFTKPHNSRVCLWTERCKAKDAKSNVCETLMSESCHILCFVQTTKFKTKKVDLKSNFLFEIETQKCSTIRVVLCL
jgi:hypothetical protein